MFSFRSRREQIPDLKPSPVLLQDLFVTGMMKAGLNMHQKGLSQKLGFYVQLMTGFKRRTQLFAGDHWRKPRLQAEFQPTPGTEGPWHLTELKRYVPGDWERLVRPSLELTAWILLWDSPPVDRIDRAVENFRKDGDWNLVSMSERESVDRLIGDLITSYRRDVCIDRLSPNNGET